MLRTGLLTPAQLRSPAWQRVLHGVYADAALPLDHGLKTRAAALTVPPDVAITGVSAAWLWGAWLASPGDPVDLVRPPGRRLGSSPQFRTRNSPLPDSDLDRLGGIRVTTPSRTAWELAQRLDLVEAVTYCDALAALGSIDRAGLAAYLASRTGQQGSRIARRVFALVDARSESPQESRLRLHLTLADLPPPIPQYEVRVAGQLLARVDFGWPQVKVAVEYDGLWHADADQLIRDRRRLNRLQAAGWYVHHVTVRDLADIDAVIRAIGHLLRRRGLIT